VPETWTPAETSTPVWTPAADEDLPFTSRGTLSSDAVTVGADTLTDYLADLETGGGGNGADHSVTVFASDVDASGGSFTDVPLYKSVDVPRAILAGSTMLVVDGDDLGLWTITASGPCAAGAALALGDVVASLSGRIGVAPSTDGTTVAAIQVAATVDGLDEAVAALIPASQKGAANGVAELDGSGLVLSSQLPSYVDDVIVVADFAALPGTGADGKIYVTSDTNLTYRWTGSAYTEISKSLALGTTSSTAYRGDHGAATAAGLADGSGVSDPAAFRGNLGLGAIATQSAIYRTDIATGAIDAALLDPALAAEIAAAVPNTRTITAGTGIATIGDLSANRTIAIDTATLARIGTTVEATSDTAARTSHLTTPADGTLEFTAAADTSYRIDAYLIFQGDATADLKVGFTIPTGTIHATVEGGLTTIASGGDYDRFLTLTLSTQTVIVGIAGASTPVAIRISGVIHTTAAGTVALIWAPNAAGAGTGVTRLARSQIYYRAA